MKKYIITNHIDIILYALMLFAAMALGANHEQNVMRAAVVLLIFMFSIIKYYLRNGMRIISSIKPQFIIWVITFFMLYIVYGNIYYINIKTFGGNDTTIVFFMFVITSILILSNYVYYDLWKFIKMAYGLALLLYFGYLYYMFSNVSLVELAGFYRIGDPVNGEYILNGNSNNIAINLSILIAPFMYELLSLKNCKWLIPVFACVVLILFTGSKKGIIVILLYFVSFYCYGNNINFKRIFSGVIVLGLFLYIIIESETLNTIIGERFFDFLNIIAGDSNINSNSTDLRTSMYSIGFNLWLDAPFIGNGLGAFQEYSGLRLYSHNTYIEILVSFGLLGLIAYYWYIVYMFFCLIRERYVIRRSIFFLVSFIAAFFMDAAAVRFYDYITWSNWVFMLLYLCYYSENKN